MIAKDEGYLAMFITSKADSSHNSYVGQSATWTTDRLSSETERNEEKRTIMERAHRLCRVGIVLFVYIDSLFCSDRLCLPTIKSRDENNNKPRSIQDYSTRRSDRQPFGRTSIIDFGQF